MRTSAIATVLAATLAAGAALAQDAGGGITVVMAMDLSEDDSQGAALNSMQPVLDYIRDRPGLISEQVLRGAVDSSHDYVHVMQWERLEDWEAMFADQAFLDILTSLDPRFAPGAAEVYLPVR